MITLIFSLLFSSPALANTDAYIQGIYRLQQMMNQQNQEYIERDMENHRRGRDNALPYHGAPTWQSNPYEGFMQYQQNNGNGW
jgi:hypothetical protein